MDCFDVSTHFAVGAGISNLPQYRSAVATAGVSGRYSFSGHFVKGGANVEQRRHPEGILRTTTVNAQYGKENKFDVTFAPILCQESCQMALGFTMPIDLENYIKPRKSL